MLTWWGIGGPGDVGGDSCEEGGLVSSGEVGEEYK